MAPEEEEEKEGGSRIQIETVFFVSFFISGLGEIKSKEINITRVRTIVRGETKRANVKEEDELETEKRKKRGRRGGERKVCSQVVSALSSSSSSSNEYI